MGIGIPGYAVLRVTFSLMAACWEVLSVAVAESGVVWTAESASA